MERKISFSLLRDFAQICSAVEPKAAALATVVAGPAEKAAIKTAIERMVAADRGEDDFEADIAFHVAILSASGNRFYSQLRKLTETALRFSIRMTNRYKGVQRASVPDHKKISDAIFAGDAATAEAAMHELIREVLDLITKAEGTALQEARSRALKARVS